MTTVPHPKALLASVAVAVLPIVTQAVTAPATDPMVVLFFRGMSVVLSTGIIVVCIRFFFYLGAASQSQKQAIESQKKLEIVVEKAGERFEHFANRVEKVLARHDGELTAHHDRIEVLERRKTTRRAADRDE